MSSLSGLGSFGWGELHISICGGLSSNLTRDKVGLLSAGGSEREIGAS